MCRRPDFVWNKMRRRVWKDTSERVARRCDYTVDKKRVNHCVLKQLFLEGVERPKTSTKKPRKCSLWRATNVTFSKFRGVSINELIRINSEQNILRSCFLHWLVPCRLRRLGRSPSRKFVRPHWWRSWVMIRFLENQGPNCRETLL